MSNSILSAYLWVGIFLSVFSDRERAKKRGILYQHGQGNRRGCFAFETKILVNDTNLNQNLRVSSPRDSGLYKGIFTNCLGSIVKKGGRHKL